MSNSFGARWFDDEWNAQFDTREWSDTLNFYVNMMNDAGPAGFATNGFNENLSLFQQGKCGMWIARTSSIGVRGLNGELEKDPSRSFSTDCNCSLLTDSAVLS